MANFGKAPTRSKVLARSLQKANETATNSLKARKKKPGKIPRSKRQEQARHRSKKSIKKQEASVSKT